jgi:hypothetical protein
MILRYYSVSGSRLQVYIAVYTWYILYESSSLLLCVNYILPKMSADERFVTADSRNLPKVDVFMIGEYLNKNTVTTLLKYSVWKHRGKYFYIPLLQCSSISTYKGAF